MQFCVRSLQLWRTAALCTAMQLRRFWDYLHVKRNKKRQLVFNLLFKMFLYFQSNSQTRMFLTCTENSNELIDALQFKKTFMGSLCDTWWLPEQNRQRIASNKVHVFVLMLKTNLVLMSFYSKKNTSFWYHSPLQGPLRLQRIRGI